MSRPSFYVVRAFASLFPNRINPLSVLNNIISRDEWTTKVSRRGDDCSVCGIADSNQRNRFQ